MAIISATITSFTLSHFTTNLHSTLRPWAAFSDWLLIKPSNWTQSSLCRSHQFLWLALLLSARPKFLNRRLICILQGYRMHFLVCLGWFCLFLPAIPTISCSSRGKSSFLALLRLNWLSKRWSYCPLFRCYRHFPSFVTTLRLLLMLSRRQTLSRNEDDFSRVPMMRFHLSQRARFDIQLRTEQVALFRCQAPLAFGWSVTPLDSWLDPLP